MLHSGLVLGIGIRLSWISRIPPFGWSWHLSVAFGQDIKRPAPKAKNLPAQVGASVLDIEPACLHPERCRQCGCFADSLPPLFVDIRPSPCSVSISSLLDLSSFSSAEHAAEIKKANGDLYLNIFFACCRNYCNVVAAVKCVLCFILLVASNFMQIQLYLQARNLVLWIVFGQPAGLAFLLVFLTRKLLKNRLCFVVAQM